MGGDRGEEWKKEEGISVPMKNKKKHSRYK